ncbi:hypothetical protein [Nocardioides sp. GCM10030258]|uniref:hypothetical protein n=1 Tax=unclassified Nocardioides TaxID=2615069 RepID=UPI00360B7F26
MNTANVRDIILSLIGYGTDRQAEFGRTSLQKVAYFAGLKTNLNLGHRAFYYGPFSSTVEEETEALVLSGLINQAVTDLGFVNRRGYPGIRYTYSLTESGRQRLGAVELQEPDLAADLKKTVDSLFDTIGSLDQGLLSIAAKTYFITDEQGSSVSFEEIRELAKQKNWEINNAQLEKVGTFLVELGLVTLTED